MEGPFAIPPHLQRDGGDLESAKNLRQGGLNMFSVHSATAPQQPDVGFHEVVDYVTS